MVGPTDTGACGGGDPTQFLYDVDAWTSGLAFNTAVVFFVIGAIELFVLAGCIYLIFCASRETVQLMTGFDVDDVEDEWKA